MCPKNAQQQIAAIRLSTTGKFTTETRVMHKVQDIAVAWIQRTKHAPKLYASPIVKLTIQCFVGL